MIGQSPGETAGAPILVILVRNTRMVISPDVRVNNRVRFASVELFAKELWPALPAAAPDEPVPELAAAAVDVWLPGEVWFEKA